VAVVWAAPELPDAGRFEVGPLAGTWPVWR
jgi:hypothetical protein